MSYAVGWARSSAPGARWGWPVEGGREGWAYLFLVAHLVVLSALALSNLFLLLGVGAVFLDRNLRRRLFSAVASNVWSVLYVASLGLSILASRDPSSSTRHLAELFGLSTLWLVPVVAAGEARVRWLLDWSIAAGAAVAGFGLLQLAIGFGGLDHRIRGPFSHYMTFSGVLVLAGLLLAARLLARRPDPEARGLTWWLDQRAISAAALALIGAALVATLTRSAWLAFALAGVALLWAFDWKRLWIVGVVLLALLALAPVSTLVRAFSIFDLEDVSNYDRLCMAWSGWQMLQQRPLLGIGPGEVKREYPFYRHPTAPRRTVPHLHNSYLQLAAERGLLGLATFGGLITVPLLRAWQGWRRSRSEASTTADLYLGVWAALVGALLAAFFEDNWGDTEVQRLWLALLGVSGALGAPGSEPGR